MKPSLRWNRMLSPARCAWEDGQRETWCCAPEDKAAAVKLQRQGLVTIRKTAVMFAGYTEWWVRLTPAGVEATEPEKQGEA